MTTAEAGTLPSPLNDARADVVLRSSDNAIFRVRRIHLQSGSRFFDDMLSSPGLGTVGEKLDGLAVVDMAETSKELTVFLRVLIPNEHSATHISMPNSLLLWNLAKKYDAPAVGPLVVKYLHFLAKESPGPVFILAVHMGDVELARQAIGFFPDVEDVIEFLYPSLQLGNLIPSQALIDLHVMARRRERPWKTYGGPPEPKAEWKSLAYLFNLR